MAEQKRLNFRIGIIRLADLRCLFLRRHLWRRKAFVTFIPPPPGSASYICSSIFYINEFTRRSLLDSQLAKAAPSATSHHIPLALAGTARRGTGGGVGRGGRVGEGLGDDAGRAVFLEDAAVDDALVDARGLEAALGDVAAAPNGLLEHAKVELALTADVVGQGVGDLGQGVGASRIEDLGGAVVNIVSLTFLCLSPGILYTRTFGRNPTSRQSCGRSPR